MRSRALLFLLFVEVATSACAQDWLDETGVWSVAGPGAIEKSQGPPPVEGQIARRCSVDEAKRGYAYFRLTPPSKDLTLFGRLRFRIYGQLLKSSLIELVIHDNQKHYSKWQPQSLSERSRLPRWTEFFVYLDSPTLDKGTDLRDVNTITWRVHVPGDGTGPREFFLDGVRLEPIASSPAPGPDEVVLEDKGFQAIFHKASRYELAALRTPSGETMPLRTSTQMIPLHSAPAEATTISIGGEVRWKSVEPSPKRLRLSYEQGDYLHQITYAWEDGALAVRRRATCLRAGRGIHGSRLHVVSFGPYFTRFLHDHGAQETGGPLPAKRADLPGNWFTAFPDRGTGVAVIFPRRVLYNHVADDRDFVVQDQGHFWFHDLEPGMCLEHEVWIVPVQGDSAASASRTAASAVCSRLARNNDPALAYFMPAYLPFRNEGRTLIINDRFVLWEAPTGVAVAQAAQPPRQRSDGLRLCLARGETEPIHLVITPHRPLRAVSVTCSGLTDGHRQIPLSTFRVRYPGYIMLRPLTDQEKASLPDPALVNFVGEVERGGEFLLTDHFYGGVAASLGPIEDPLFDTPLPTLRPGQNQPIWITLAAPSDTQPGEYQGYILFHENGAELGRVPLKVKVWSFTLPRVTSLRTWYQLWLYPQAMPFWREYYRNLAEHKVSGFGGTPGTVIEKREKMPVGPLVKYEGGRVSVDWSAFDRVTHYLFDELGMRHCKLPHGQRGGGHVKVRDFAGLKENTPEFERAFYDYLCQAQKHLSERGWLSGMDCYIFDEPDRERIEVVRRTAAIVRRAMPQMRIFPACAHNTRTLIGVLNAWCPPTAYFGLPTGDFSPERIAEARARGEVFWWYNQADNAIGSPVITHRALPWATWKENIVGYFVWCINYWGTAKFPYATSTGVGDAMVLYPGKSGPVDTLRWEQTRDGLEDYDYLVMLEQAIQRPGIAADLAKRGHNLLMRARSLLVDARCLIAVNPDSLQALRTEIGELLDHLAGEETPR